MLKDLLIATNSKIFIITDLLINAIINKNDIYLIVKSIFMVDLHHFHRS